MVDIIIGDSRPYAVQLTIDGATFVIDQSAVAKSALCSPDKKTVLSEVITLYSTTPGADWTKSKLIVQFPRSGFRRQDYQGPAQLEIQITMNGADWTWHVPVNLVKGVI